MLKTFFFFSVVAAFLVRLVILIKHSSKIRLERYGICAFFLRVCVHYCAGLYAQRPSPIMVESCC